MLLRLGSDQYLSRLEKGVVIPVVNISVFEWSSLVITLLSLPPQGGVIMLLGFWLFDSELIHVVSITFTALILTELLMVALTIRTWHGLMMVAELISIAIYVFSLLVLRDYFGQFDTICSQLSLCIVILPQV